MLSALVRLDKSNSYNCWAQTIEDSQPSPVYHGYNKHSRILDSTLQNIRGYYSASHLREVHVVHAKEENRHQRRDNVEDLTESAKVEFRVRVRVKSRGEGKS